MSSIGTTCAYPPPQAPPFIPKQGPSEGSRKAITDFLPIFLRPSPSAIVTVDFPSPAAVGVIAVTKTSFPREEESSAFFCKALSFSKEIFAL